MQHTHSLDTREHCELWCRLVKELLQKFMPAVCREVQLLQCCASWGKPHCRSTMCRDPAQVIMQTKTERQHKVFGNMQDIRTGSLRPWIVILTDVGVFVVAVVLPAARVLLRCTRGCGRNKLRFAATRGALFTAERCSSAPPMVAAIVPLLSYCAAAVGITTVQARPHRRR